MGLKKSVIEKIFKLFQAKRPHPETELKFANDFQLLVAVMLSAQAQDKVVNQVTEKLFKKVRHASDVLKLTEAELSASIKKLGLFRTKAANILKTSRILVEKYQNRLPQKREELESLPGVGKKTAAVLVNSLYRQPAIAVDTHVFRVAARIGLASAKTPTATEAELLKVVPKWALLDAHHWLVLHGRYICSARNPKCQQCFLAHYCQYQGGKRKK